MSKVKTRQLLDAIFVILYDFDCTDKNSYLSSLLSFNVCSLLEENSMELVSPMLDASTTICSRSAT